MSHWINASVNRKFVFGLGAGLLSASMLFVVLFVGFYRNQLEQERSAASEQVNLLLQAALENAMLKRDLDGLANIVSRLGEQQGVRRVMIVNPHNEIRFSSKPDAVGHVYAPKTDTGCATCHAGDGPATGRSQFLIDEQGHEVLRSVNPVHNKAPCVQCHGPVDQHPINGILLVDWDAATVRASARNTAVVLISAGGFVVLGMALGTWWLVRRHVLSPVNHLRAAALQLAEGNLETRTALPGADEFSDLGRTFNAMAEALQSRIRQVRDKEAFLQSLIDAIPDGIRVIDDQWRVVVANQAYRHQLGRDNDTVVGEFCYHSSHGRNEACPATLITCPLEEIRRGLKPMRTVHEHVRADGSPLHVETYAAAMRLEQDGAEKSYVVEAIRDLDQEVRYSHEQKLAALGQLAAGVAHEIRNPLASIRLAFQGILRSSAGDMNLDEVKAYLRLVDGQIDKCIDVTERLLKLSVSASDHLELVSLNTTISETVSLINFHAQQLGVALEIELSPESPRVMATDSEIRMVVLNLVQNAFHAMPKGGTLAIRCHAEDRHVTMSFQDSGAGIRPEHLARIFDPFFSVRADGENGTGLGLTICKNIVVRFDGRIEVESEAGLGARFTVVLPSAAAAMEGAAS